MLNRHLLESCTQLLLRPVVRFCVSRGVKFRDFVELAKESFIDEAAKSLNDQNATEISSSKLSVMTGIQRPEVKRIHDNIVKAQSRNIKQGKSSTAQHRLDLYNRDIVARLLGQWSTDKRFLDSKGKPRALTIRGAKSEFARLVKTVNTDLNPHTVRFELERLELIENEEHCVRLQNSADITTGEPVETLKGAVNDVRDLMEAASANSFLSTGTPHLHARTTYDNIADVHRDEIQGWLLKLGREIHDRVRAYVSRFDRDITPAKSSAQQIGRNRVVLGTFSLFEPFNDPSLPNHSKKTRQDPDA